MASKGHSKQPLRNGYVSKAGHDAYDAQNHDDFQTSPTYMTKTEKPIHVRVHVNRNKHEPGKKMVVAKHKVKTFENFLNECTEKCKPYFGGARRVYTARGRHRIQSLDDLGEDCIYVITGTEQFEKHNYKDIPERTRPVKNNKKLSKPDAVPPVIHPRDQKLRSEPGRSWELSKQYRGLRVIVHKNGENSDPAHPVSILHRDRENFLKISEEIEKSMNLPPLHQIYKCHNLGGRAENFERLTQASQLQQDDHLVVLPKTGYGNTLKVIDYPLDGKSPFSVMTSPRIGPYWNYPSFQSDKVQTRHNYSLNRNKVVPSIGSSKQSNATSPFSNPPGSQGGRKGNKPKRGTGKREVDYDKDEGGVYRAKKQDNAKGAHQERVDEDAGMHHVNEFEDDSFNRYDRNTSGAMSKDPRSSTPASRAEKRRKKEQQEYEAAAKIQAGARAYKARKEYKEKKEAKRQETNNERNQLDDEARREEGERQQEEANWQAEQDRQREEEDARWQAEQDREREMTAQKKKMDEDQAATKIQASFKGHKARKDYQAKKQAQGQQ